ncbi:MAG: LysM repeat protein [Planctomycetota bacterium]|jgi:LysM repeat protein
MGQLEKYGLYVLCLVIFLILGVTIWGNPDSPSLQQKSEVVSMRLGASGRPVGPANSQLTLGNFIPDSNSSRSEPGSFGIVQSLLQPVKSSRASSKPKLQVEQKPVDEKPLVGKPPVGKPPVGKPPVGKPPVVKPEPVATTRNYTVKKGDILGRIAQKQLGSIRYVSDIRKLNRGLGDTLKIGQVLILPASGKSKADTVATSADFRTYTISPGDTFERIAWIEFKARSRARELQALNPNVNPTHMIPGSRIKLPLK